LEHGASFFFQDSTEDLNAMIDGGAGKKIEHGPGRAAFGVVGPEHHARYPSRDQGPRAHDARLLGDVERGSTKPPYSKSGRGFAESKDFGVSGGIRPGFFLVLALDD
jgi:hypothetical protein